MGNERTEHVDLVLWDRGEDRIRVRIATGERAGRLVEADPGRDEDAEALAELHDHLGAVLGLDCGLAVLGLGVPGADPPRGSLSLVEWPTTLPSSQWHLPGQRNDPLPLDLVRIDDGE